MMYSVQPQPQSFRPPTPHVGPDPSSAKASAEKILIVDDSAVVRRGFSKLLSGRYKCVESDSAIDAISRLRETSFDLVITDILMPGLSGIELLRKVVENQPETAVIVVSGIDRPQRALDAIRLGAADYLIKPCDPEVLQFTVERTLERSALLKNARKYKQDLEARNDELLRKKEQLERLQAQIIHSEKMASLGQLAAGIAHELNNPVGYVHGNMEILENCAAGILKLLKYYDDAGITGPVAEGAAKIKAEIGYDYTVSDLSSIISDCRDGAERVRDIVQNLRTFSRLDEAEFKMTDIHEGIDSTIRLLSRYFSGGKIRLLREYGELPSVEAYSAQLNQVWANLLINAAQAVSENGGEVCLRTHLDGDSVVIAVSDNGVGISPENLSRIFDPFFTTKAVGDGTGLGLSISFGIIERHGGKISVESVPGTGSTFTVTLPINFRPGNASDSGPSD